MPTYSPKASEIDRNWLIIDADGLVLGRLATEVASILRGKHKPTYTPNTMSGDYVVILNADKVRVTGRKDMWGEVESFICNTCRFDKKDVNAWTIEGPRKIDRHSVISQGHYPLKLEQPLLSTPAPNVPELAKRKELKER